jgi:hypothetical protein
MCQEACVFPLNGSETAGGGRRSRARNGPANTTPAPGAPQRSADPVERSPGGAGLPRPGARHHHPVLVEQDLGAPSARIASPGFPVAPSTTRRPPGATTRRASSQGISAPPVKASACSDPARKGSMGLTAMRLTPAGSFPTSSSSVRVTTSTSGIIAARAGASSAPPPITATVPDAPARPISAASQAAPSSR